MDAEIHVPPGFRFHPTEEELVGYYLKKKVASNGVEMAVIKDVDLYRIEPWDLHGSMLIIHCICISKLPIYYPSENISV